MEHRDVTPTSPERSSASSSRPLVQIAPMMEVTYRDFRQFMRILTKRTQLWTEMHVDNTLRYTKVPLEVFLGFGQNEHPIVCQLGGSVPNSLAEAAQIVDKYGYDEINLNCGCPSDRVSGKGEFGASLMKKPELVRDCMRTIADAVKVPLTVKCRLGVDDLDSPEFTANFVRTVAEGGVQHFIIHARKCILQGLTPDQNRKIPPLMYDRVFLLCREFPHLSFTLNGGVNTLEEVRQILDTAPPNLIGVMIGRAALGNPCMLWDADRYIFGEPNNPSTASSRHSILTAYCEYLEEAHPIDGPVCSSSASGGCHAALKPVLGVFNGLRGNKILRQNIDILCRDKSLRAQGPGHILRKVIAMLEADERASVHLFEPLAPAGSQPPQPTPPADIPTTRAERVAARACGMEATSAVVLGEPGTTACASEEPATVS